MSFNSWNQSLVTQQVDSTALTNSTTATSILAPAARFTLPANLLAIGTKFMLRAAGRISTVVTTPGTLTLDVRFGSTVVFNGGAMALNTTAQTNASWYLEAELVCRSIGASTAATLLGAGSWTSRAVVGSAAAGSGGVGTLMLPDTAPAVGTGFDSTSAQIVDMFGTWSIASGSNSIQVHNYELVLCN